MGLSSNTSYYKRVRSRKTIWAAWKKVYQNGIISKSELTRKEVGEFAENAFRYIENIQRKLGRNTFTFQPAKGVLKRRIGKSARPLVVSPIENRIVQRAILDVIQDNYNIQEILRTENSFGGLENRSVAEAIFKVMHYIRSGYTWYIKSDISDFFSNIPKPRIVQFISDIFQEDVFTELFSQAITVELKNMKELGSHAELFPIFEIGVAQGCCLSPLIGNLYLSEFDSLMNKNNVVCIRYIDDFILLAKKQNSVKKAFEKGIHWLKNHNLNAYSPFENTEKASYGHVMKGFELLGCSIKRDLIRPNQKARKRLLKNISLLISDSLSSFHLPSKALNDRTTIIDTLVTINNIVKGWGKQYGSYCNDRETFVGLDIEIGNMINQYLIRCGRIRRRLEDSKNIADSRRFLGIIPLVDCLIPIESTVNI